MQGFIARTLISALGLWLASEIVPGMYFTGFSTLLAAALLLGVANAVVRPILVVITFPITILSVGIFLVVINGAMIWLVAWFLKGFTLDGFLPAVFASVIVSLTGWFASWFIGPRGRIAVMHDRDD